MHSYVGILAVMLPQQILHLGCFVMRLAKRDVSVHQDVKLYGIVIADTPGMEVMRFLNSLN